MEKRLHTLFEENLKNIVEEALEESLFTACSSGILICTPAKTTMETFHFGHTGSLSNCSQVDKHSVFDLASLTKPLVVSLLVMCLCDEDKLAINDNVYKFFGAKSGEWGQITLSSLLHHISGLPAHRPFYEVLGNARRAERKKKLIDLIFTEKFSASHSGEEVYSDLGYMLLGSIIEKVSGEELAAYWTKRITRPLGLEKDLFFPAVGKIAGASYVSTGRCLWSGQELSGIVHDDNCRSIGGIAGHAGLFGTVAGVMSIVETLMKNYAGLENKLPCNCKKYLTRTGQNRSRWIFGFDTPSGENSTSGRYFSQKSIGHLGFTGTSFWVDLNRNIGIVLLTNRVRTGGSITKMRDFRSRFHDLVMEFLLQKIPPDI